MLGWDLDGGWELVCEVFTVLDHNGWKGGEHRIFVKHSLCLLFNRPFWEMSAVFEILYRGISGVVPRVEPVVVHGSLTYKVIHIPLNPSLCHSVQGLLAPTSHSS